MRPAPSVPFLLLLAAASAGAASSRDVTMPLRGICAHRGAMATHPENTLPAFREAIRLGCHMIELDVCLSKDSQLIVIHDHTADRTTDGKGKVAELTLAELKTLDAGIKKGKAFQRTRIPTLAEALEAMPENIWLNVHLKGGAALGAAVAREVARQRRQHQAFLACGIAAARGARKAVPGILICNMQGQSIKWPYVRATIAARCRFIQLYGRSVPPADMVAELKKHGVAINYFPGTPHTVRKLLEAGVEFPLVDDPATCLKLAAQLGIQPLKPIYRTPPPNGRQAPAGPR